VEKYNRVTAQIELFQEKWVASLFSDKVLGLAPPGPGVHSKIQNGPAF